MITVETIDLVASGQIGSAMSGSLTSEGILVERLVSVAFQPVYTGTLGGSFIVDYSLDNVNWNQKASQLISAAGSWYMDFTDPILTTKYIRIRWVPTSGSGVLTSCLMTCKG